MGRGDAAMIENFIEYMWYLLTTPLKKLKKALNKWYILCKVFGRRFDEVKEDILRARDEGMVATCSHEMLSVHGADRRLTRYEGESAENYRSRIAMYDELCKLGGTNEGVLLAVKTLGFEDVEIKTARELKGDTERWAEFYALIRMDMGWAYNISFNILKKNVRAWKEVGAKDNYQFILQSKEQTGKANDICRIAEIWSMQNENRPENKFVFQMEARNIADTELTVEIKNNLWHLDGAFRLDGGKLLNAYELKEKA